MALKSYLFNCYTYYTIPICFCIVTWLLYAQLASEISDIETIRNRNPSETVSSWIRQMTNRTCIETNDSEPIKDGPLFLSNCAADIQRLKSGFQTIQSPCLTQLKIASISGFVQSGRLNGCVTVTFQDGKKTVSTLRHGTLHGLTTAYTLHVWPM